MHEYERIEEKNIKVSKGHVFGDKENITGTLVLSNIRIYLQVDEDHKYNEILPKFDSW